MSKSKKNDKGDERIGQIIDEETEKENGENPVDKGAQRQETKRDPSGRFVKGIGGPGRRKGNPSRLISMGRESLERVWPKIEEEALKGNTAAMELIVRFGMPKTKQFVADPEAVSTKEKKILTQLKEGEITVKDAALELNLHGIALPESVKILLAKEEPEPDTSGEEYCTISTEELERRKAAAEQVAAGSEEFVEERRKEMNELHKSVADSFAPEATGDEAE